LLERSHRLVEFGERFLEQRRVVLVVCERNQLAGVGKLLFEFEDGVYVPGEVGALFTERLRVVGLVPNPGVAEFEFDFRQPFLFAIEVKDTP